MSFKEELIQMTDKAGQDFLLNVRAMPPDKLTWKPLGTGRSALDLLQEVAQSASYVIPILETRHVPDFNPEMFTRLMAERQTWDTIEKCEEVMRANHARLFEIIRNFPDEDLQHTVHLPFGEGFDQTMAEIMSYQYWNLSYHLGQVCYIQTLYGDMEIRVAP
jgi:hypothetical protein